MTKRETAKDTIKKFLKTTTLHGFKYLSSEYFGDRIGWLLCCCASACCAGVLCGVLWARFLKVPALLALHDLREHDPALNRLPIIAVCPAVKTIAERFIPKLTSNKTLIKEFPNILARALDGKPCSKLDLDTFDQLLADNNATLYGMMEEHMPPCDVVVKKCRWQTQNKPCQHLFEKEATGGKICCVMRSNVKLIKRNKKSNLLASLEAGQQIELALQCSSGSTHYGCEFFTKYDGELWVNPGWLNPGNYYIAQLRFTSIPESPVSEKLVEESCVSESGYSQSDCLFECAEKQCGCVDPMRGLSDNSTEVMPPCHIANLKCLRTSALLHNSSCYCLPPCKKITTYMTLETSPMNFIQHTIDPIFSGLNVSSSIVMHFRVNIHLSRTFILNPTETWLTLLSSLGGVFNMFLGVGLFSALELLSLIFVKLPIAMQRSTKITQHTHKQAI